LPSLKAIADVVTEGARGAGVAEAIDLLLAGQFDRHEDHESTKVTKTK
jgi:hypothetical protein